MENSIIGICLQSSSLRVVAGRVKSHTKIAVSGNTITRKFCPKCGSPLFTRASTKPQYIWVKVGSLDDPKWVKPMYQIWTDSAVPWAYINTQLPSFPQNRNVL